MPTITVKGMSCDHCRRSVTEALSKLPGVSAVVVDLGAATATWQGASDAAAVETAKKAVKAIGFETPE